MEIQAIPFNEEKSMDQLVWKRFAIHKNIDSLKIVISTEDDPHFLYQVILDKEAYIEMQKK